MILDYCHFIFLTVLIVVDIIDIQTSYKYLR
jgi:hypothetical protein